MKEKDQIKSKTEKELEEEVFKRLPEWCKSILKLSKKYENLYRSASFNILPKRKK